MLATNLAAGSFDSAVLLKAFFVTVLLIVVVLGTEVSFVGFEASLCNAFLGKVAGVAIFFTTTTFLLSVFWISTLGAGLLAGFAADFVGCFAACLLAGLAAVVATGLVTDFKAFKVGVALADLPLEGDEAVAALPLATAAFKGAGFTGADFAGTALTLEALGAVTDLAFVETSFADPAFAEPGVLFTTPALPEDFTAADLPEPLPELTWPVPLPELLLPELDLPVLFKTMVASAFTKKTRSLRIESTK